MIKKSVEKNTFYKSSTLSVGAQVSPTFSDLPTGGGSASIVLQGGYKSTYYALSGSIPTTPAYGSSEVCGAFLSVYCESIALANTPTLPQIELYKLNDGITIDEGTLQVAYLSGNSAYSGVDNANNANYLDGAAISVYHSVANSDNFYKYENFDGADKTLGDITILKSVGTGVVELSDAFLTKSIALSTGINLGTNMLHQRKKYGLEQYFIHIGDMNVPIKPETDNINGVWRPQIDFRNSSKEKLVWSKPYWKYKDIKDSIQFSTRAPVTTSEDAQVEVTPGNTIFDEVYTTANTNNPFTSDTNNPLMMTSAELSTTKKYSGAQAFRMYHLWDYSASSANLQRALGSKAIMPSMTRASIYNIPLPHSGIDYGQSSWGATPLPADNSMIVPEISMRMNIAKLGFAPYISAKANTTGGFTSSQTYYPSGAASTSGGEGSGGTNTSLLRSVVVTWSNYKPKEDHTTLDKFLDYGLNRFYTGATSEHIVGGVAFFKVGIDGTSTSNPSTLMASALPVQKWMGNDGSAVAGTTLVSGGLAKFSGLASGTYEELENTMLVGCDSWDNITTNGVRFVSLPMDSWFNMRTFIDIGATNYHELPSQQNIYYGIQSANYARYGAPMRVVFESDIVKEGVVEGDNPNDSVDFLDVYFPNGNTLNTGNNPRSVSYNFRDNPEMYPKHMTVWVQNYRWIESSDKDTTTELTQLNSSMGAFQFGDNGGLVSGTPRTPGDTGPLPNGAAIEAEVFIDDIILKNFTPQITNCSPGASVSTQQPIQMKSASSQSPYTIYVVGTTGGAPSSGAAVRTWSTETQGFGATGSLYDYISTECILFGFDDTGQLPLGPTTGDASWQNRPTSSESYGFMLGNGFSTMLYESMARTKPLAFLSSYGNKSSPSAYNKKLGGQFYGRHDYAGSASAILAKTDGEFQYNNNVGGSEIYVTNDASDITTQMFTTMSSFGSKAQINLMTYNELPTTTTSTMPSSMDGFTSKGLMRMYVSGTDVASTNQDAYSPWVKREHIMASTKIEGFKNFPGKGVDSLTAFQLKVADPTIFNKYYDDEFIIYKMGEAVTTSASGSVNTRGWGIHADSTSIKLNHEVEIDGAQKIVTFNVDLTMSDQYPTQLLNEANLSSLWISPKKYWITLAQPADKTVRTYSNFCMVQDVGATGLSNVDPITSTAMSGSTWNESVYGYDNTLRGTGTDPTNYVGQAGLYTSTWNLDPGATGSSIVSNKDYGYGTYNEETRQGGELAQATALINNWVYLDLDGLANTKDTSEEDPLVVLLGMDDGGLEKVSITSDEGADLQKLPTLYWQYKDAVPLITTPLSVAPNYNILSGSGQNKVDLYKLDREELNALKLTWEEEADDIVYRLLYISTGNINSKYAEVAFQAPLNELASAGVATGSYYTGSSRVAAGTFNTSTKRTITGSSGWAYDGNLATSALAVDWPQTTASVAWSYFNNTEATFVVHAVPRDESTQTQGTLFTDNSSTKGAFKIYYTKVGSANADVTPVVSLTSGATVLSGKTVTLTSDYSFPNDGESPLFIVVTFNANLDSNHIKMYVNGKLVKQSAGNWTKGNNLYDGTTYDGSINIGNEADTGGTKKLRGTVQECIVHNKELYVPTSPNEYILSTQFLPDKSAAGGTALKYNARLFLFDYHNIIGTSRDTVCSSDSLSWEATPI